MSGKIAKLLYFNGYIGNRQTKSVGSVLKAYFQQYYIYSMFKRYAAILTILLPILNITNRFYLKFFYSVAALLLFISSVSAQVTFTNFEDARLIVGQPDFTSANSQVTASNAVGASSIAVSNVGRLAVASQSAGRVLIWHSLPTSNGQPADVVVGKPDFTSSSSAAPSAASMRNCEGVAFSPDGNKLIVSDGENNRVLIWNTIPTTNGQPADVVIGQVDFTSATPGLAADKLQYPVGVLVTRTGKLIINDAFNHRVLVYNTIPTVNGAAADVVIGQQTMLSNSIGNAATQLNRPWTSAETPEGKLLISDFNNHRVLIFNTIPTTNGAAANAVIGQTGFNTVPTSGTTNNKLKNPLGITVSAAGRLAIADAGNHRVVIYNTVPAANAATADVVLGQANFTASQDYSSNLSARATVSPNSVQFDFNGRLFVSGRQGSGLFPGRVLVFGAPGTTETDLSISSQATMALPCQDITLQYHIRILNNGPNNTTNISANLFIPDELTRTGSTPPTPSAGTYSAQTGIWTIPTLTIGQAATITFTGTVSPNFSGRTIRQNAILTASGLTDNNMINNASGSELKVINNKPDAPTANSNSVTVCVNNDTTLVASGAGTIRWYTVATGGNPIFTGSTFNTPNLTATTIYYAESSLGDGCAFSARTPVTVTVNPLITNNTISGTQTVCQYVQPTTLTGSVPSGGNSNYQYQWQYSPDGVNWSNIQFATNQNYNSGGLGGTSWFRRRVIAGPCAYSFSDPVKITVNPLSPVSFSGLPEKACSDTPVITLTGNQTGGVFAGPGISGNTFNPATAGTGRHTITYSFTNSHGCTNTTSAVILVGATVFAGNNQTVCVDAGAFALQNFAPAGGTWSGAGVNASGTFNPATAGAGSHTLTYSVTSTFGCGSTPQTVTSTKIVQVVPLPVLNLGGTRKVCADTADFYLRGYSPLNGTWTGTGVRNDGYFSPRTASVGTHTLTYRYRDGNGCENTGTKTVEVTALPTVTLQALTKQCSSVYTPFNLTGGAPAGGTYSGPGVNNNRFNPSVAGVGTHTITYTYKDANGCVASASRPVVVEVCLPPDPNPNPDPNGIAEDKIKSTLLIYPNPAQTQVAVQFEVAAPSALTVKLINLAGQVVYQQQYAKVVEKHNQVVDVKKLAKGIYLLQLVTDKAVVNHRVVVE